MPGWSSLKSAHKKRLEELGIPFWNFYKAKQKSRREDEQEAQSGQFVQLSSGRYVPQTMPPARTAVKSVKPAEEESGSYLTIEFQTHARTAMRIQGVMTLAHLRELITPAMFSLDNTTMRYWLYNRPVDMRSGDVFVFINAARNRMKILHREEGGIVLYALRIELG